MNLPSLLFLLLLLESLPPLVGFVWHAGNILSFAPRGERTLTDDDLARASGRQMDPPLPAAAGHRAGHLVVLSRHLARAGRRRVRGTGGTLAARGEIDYRPMVALTLVTFILTFHEYYGRPGLLHACDPRPDRRARARASGIDLRSAALRRAVPAVVVGIHAHRPATCCRSRSGRCSFAATALLDFGLRGRGFRAHAWIYALCVVVMIPVMLIVSMPARLRRLLPDVQAGGPVLVRLRRSGRSIYLAQFFALEMFFRGFWLRALRSFGSGAIFAMAVPYCMIHYGKPYLEASVAVIAGVVLGSLAMRTRSIYAGFLVHATVAVADGHPVAGRARRAAGAAGALVRATDPFLYWHVVIWAAWTLALCDRAQGVARVARARRSRRAAGRANVDPAGLSTRPRPPGERVRSGFGGPGPGAALARSPIPNPPPQTGEGTGSLITSPSGSRRCRPRGPLRRSFWSRS